MTNNLCEIYPSLNPFILRKERAREVFILISRYRKFSKKKKKNKNGKRIIRRPASDNWF